VKVLKISSEEKKSQSAASTISNRYDPQGASTSELQAATATKIAVKNSNIKERH